MLYEVITNHIDFEIKVFAKKGIFGGNNQSITGGGYLGNGSLGHEHAVLRLHALDLVRQMNKDFSLPLVAFTGIVITSYSIHYTKLYDNTAGAACETGSPSPPGL